MAGRKLRLRLVVALFGLMAGATMAPPGGSARAQAPADTAAATLDIGSGKVDATPLSERREISASGAPVMPTRTVEGVMVSRDEAEHAMTVRTRRDGDVKIGLPPDLVPLRQGEPSTLDAIRIGDEVYATVETAYGVRAIRLVSKPPTSPLVNYVGIPVLLLIALAIWWTGRGRAESAEKERPVTEAQGKG